MNPNPNEAFSMDHYRGVYLLMEKIKRSPDRMDVIKLDKTDFNQNGGSVPVGFNLEMSEESGFPAFPGEVHYTMDGNDPAAPGSTPFIYVSPLALNENARVFARTKNATKGTWDPGV